MNVLLHLHPQGAYIARAINFLSSKYKKATIYPIKMPTFLDQLNTNFARFLVKEANQPVKINSDSSVMTWDPCLLTRNEGINWETIPYLESEKFTGNRDYNNFITKSIIDTASRNLLFPSEKYFIEKEKRTEYERYLKALHDKIFNVTLKTLYAKNINIIVVSHMNYIFYTPLLLAADYAGIPVLLLHGGYNETILFEKNSTRFCSPSDVRKNVLDKRIQHLHNNHNSGMERTALYDSYLSISDMSHTIKALQNKIRYSETTRLVLINHQVISEICFHFEPDDKTQLSVNRYDILEKILKYFIEKDVKILLRTHPATDDYPGELEIVKNLVTRLGSPLIRLFSDKGTDKIERELKSTNIFPEIYSLGGSATCELISQGIQAYSIGNCQMPKSCSNYVVPIVSKIESHLNNCYLNTKVGPSTRQIKDAKSFIKLAKLTYHRRTKFNVDLEKADTFYHFGNVKNPEYQLQSLLSDAVNSRLTKDYISASTDCKSAELFFNEK